MSRQEVPVLLNGFAGEIGRSAFRELTGPDRDSLAPLKLVRVNNRTPLKVGQNALLRYEIDLLRHYPGYIVQEGSISTPAGEIPAIHVDTVDGLKAAGEGIQILLEGAGVFNKKNDIDSLLERFPIVILGTPFGKGIDDGDYPTLLRGVNDDMFRPEKHRGISAGSCTTVAAGLTLAMLGFRGEKIKEIREVSLITDHAKTPSQNGLQGTHKKWGGMVEGPSGNIILSSTGAERALEQIFPGLKGKISVSESRRYDVPRGSILSMHILVENPVKLEQILDNARQSVSDDIFAGTAAVAEPEDELLTIKRVLANDGFRDKAAILITDKVRVMGAGYLIKTLTWYNNVDGYRKAWLEIGKKIARSM